MNILILLPLRSTWQMSVSYDLFKRSANFNLTERAIWVTGSTNFETEATFGWFQPQTWKLPWCVLSNMTPIELDAKDNRNGFSRTVELFESLNLPTPKYVMSRAKNRLGQFFVLGNAIDGSRLILEMQLGHVCIFPHMSKRLPYGDFQLTLKLEHEWLDFTWIRILFMYSSRCLFLWMVQRKFAFLNLKRGDGTTQELVSGAFRVCKFQSGLLAKYFILAKWLQLVTHTHTNVGQTGGDLSFRVPYLFQIHWPHGVFHQKMRSRNLQFLCSLWQLGFFLNVKFSSFKTPPALHSVAKCFAASTQHWCLWNNATSKTAGLCIGVEASFYGWCNANPDFWIWSE